MKTAVAAIILGLLLTGCGSSIKFGATRVTQDPVTGAVTTEYSPGELNEKLRAEARKECFAMLKDQEAQDMLVLSSVDKDKLALLMMGRQSEKAMLAMAGKLPDPCKEGTNIYDVAMKEVEEKNATVRAIVPPVAGAAGAAYLGGKIVDGVVQVAKDAGPKNETNIVGDSNSIDSKSDKTSINNEVNATTREGNASATSDPTNTSNPAPAAAGGSGISPEAQAAWSRCSSAGGTQGQVASCMAASGVDVKIEGGITYVEGTRFGPANSFPYTPVAE